MELTVKLSDKEYAALIDKAKEEVRDELTEEHARHFLKTHPWLSVTEILEAYGLYDRYNQLMKDIKAGMRHERKFEELTRHDQQIIAIYGIVYGKISK
jgi:hypothetical protein